MKKWLVDFLSGEWLFRSTGLKGVGLIVVRMLWTGLMVWAALGALEAMRAYLASANQNFVTAASALAAMATAFLTYLTVREMAANRKAGARPELTATNQQAQVHHQQGGSMLYMWTNAAAPTGANAPPSSFSLRVINIGSGPAKNVVATWSFEAEQLLAGIYEPGLEQVRVDYEAVLGTLRVSPGWRASQTMYVSAPQRANYVLNVIQNAEGLAINFPDVLLAIVSLRVATNANYRRAPPAAEEALLTLDYTDVEGSSYVKRLKLSFHVLLVDNGSPPAYSPRNNPSRGGVLPSFMEFDIRVEEDCVARG